MNPWWGYLHTDGSIHAKRYFGPMDIQEARESDFVAEIHGPFPAKSALEAYSRLREHFKAEPEEK